MYNIVNSNTHAMKIYLHLGRLVIAFVGLDFQPDRSPSPFELPLIREIPIEKRDIEVFSQTKEVERACGNVTQRFFAMRFMQLPVRVDGLDVYKPRSADGSHRLSGLVCQKEGMDLAHG